MALSGTFYGTTTNERVQPKIVWSATQSIAGNYSTVTATLYYSRTNTGYETYGSAAFTLSINGDTAEASKTISITYNSNTEAISHMVQVAHESNGSKSIVISATGRINASSVITTTISSTITLDTIPRASSLTASNGTLGTAQTLTITRADSSFKHKITYACGSASGYAAGSSSAFTTATSVSWTPPLTLASQNTTGTSVSITFTLYTYTSGGTQIGKVTKTISASIPASVVPTCSVAVSDSTGYASTYGGYIQGLSKAQVTVTGTPAHGSAIKSYSTTAFGSTYTVSSFTTNPPTSSGSFTISATVTDARKRKGTASASVTVLAYTKPTITAFSVHRCDSDGTSNDQGEYVKVVFSSKVTSLSSKNKATYTLKYKKTTASSYTSQTLTAYANNFAVSNGQYIFAAGTDSSYNVALYVADNFYSLQGGNTIASTAAVLMDFAKDGIGMGKVSEAANALDMGWNIELNDHNVLKNGATAFAPADRGIGNVQWLSNATDIDTVQSTGVYSYSDGNTSANIPSPLGELIAINRTPSIGTQFAIDDNYPNLRLKVRKRSGGTWQSWEWVNPPMVVGVEYRTTERSDGDPVYAKRVSYTNSAEIGNASGVAMVDIPHSISGFGKLVRIVGRNYTSNYPLPYIGSTGGITVVNAVNTTNIRLRTKDMTWASGYTWYFDIYYTK